MASSNGVKGFAVEPSSPTNIITVKEELGYNNDKTKRARCRLYPETTLESWVFWGQTSTLQTSQTASWQNKCEFILCVCGDCVWLLLLQCVCSCLCSYVSCCECICVGSSIGFVDWGKGRTMRLFPVWASQHSLVARWKVRGTAHLFLSLMAVGPSRLQLTHGSTHLL